MSLWLEFRAALSQPEYVHVLLNPLPVYGLAIGILAWILASVARSRAAQVLALVLIFLAGLSAWPVAHFGKASYDRVYSMSGPQAQLWLNWHRHIAEKAVWSCYAAAIFAVAGLTTLWRWSRFHRSVVALTLLAAIFALALGGLAGFAGGKIRHSEFRDGPPPAWANTSDDTD